MAVRMLMSILVSISAILTLTEAAFDANCAKCLCHIQSDCNANDPAGPYKISWAYWADAGKPTVNGEDPSSETAFHNCLRDETCNFYAVSGYMKKFEQDCNGDGQIECIDYIQIHVFGGYGCAGNLPFNTQKKYESCLLGRV